ncbi:peptidase M4 [Streptomyces sp. SID4928]|uniref:PepSY domain-containing protein n=1 Tax=unclassified Streptomyces TaxID=2593676 RepID=UPI0001C1971E|nr:PepSY domain-containing protein [Streptomyces sp. ACT-1]EGE41732.1 Propeptide PepSY amd peptidase M4 [Streptomyces sp. ACT-1]MYR49787.1 peptidase M4 [Streptomyces sp. SID4928]
MKRNVTIAAITAAVLIGGTTAATVAFADDGDRRGGTSAQQPAGTDRDDRDDRDDDRSPAGAEAPRTDGGAKTTKITLDQAVAAALKNVPGTVTGAELDDDDDDRGRAVWELDVRGSDKKWHDVTVDAANGKVLKTRDDDNDDRDRHAPRSSTVTLDRAVDAALKTAPGSVTSIDLDDDDDDRGDVLRWDVEITGKDGEQHELHVDARTGEVTVDRDDDGDDDRDDRADDRDDDRDDHGDDRDGDDG